MRARDLTTDVLAFSTEEIQVHKIIIL